MRTYMDPSGHKRVRLCKDGVSKAFHVHQLVLTAFSRKKRKGEVCRHLNGNPTDNRATNLCWGSYKENTADAIAHGTFRRGKTHGMSKLNEDAVREIRSIKDWSFGTLTKIANKYGVKKSTVLFVKKGETWRHVK